MNDLRKPVWLAGSWRKIDSVPQRRRLRFSPVLTPAVIAVGVVAGGFLAVEAQAEPQPALAIIRVDIKSLRNNTGQAGCVLFRSADGFPGDMSKAVERILLPIKEKAAICEFKAVSPGIYAIAAIHDENGNGKLDRPIFGAPTEGWGASRDARAGFMRGPRFEDAALRFAAGTTTVSITIHYP
jgi:uncharacterized protein (DUF2141 family)